VSVEVGGGSVAEKMVDISDKGKNGYSAPAWKRFKKREEGYV